MWTVIIVRYVNFDHDLFEGVVLEALGFRSCGSGIGGFDACAKPQIQRNHQDVQVSPRPRRPPPCRKNIGKGTPPGTCHTSPLGGSWVGFSGVMSPLKKGCRCSLAYLFITTHRDSGLMFSGLGFRAFGHMDSGFKIHHACLS